MTKLPARPRKGSNDLTVRQDEVAWIAPLVSSACRRLSNEYRFDEAFHVRRKVRGRRINGSANDRVDMVPLLATERHDGSKDLQTSEGGAAVIMPEINDQVVRLFVRKGFAQPQAEP